MQSHSEISVLYLTTDRQAQLQRFTVAFNFLCVLLGLLYEDRHLSLSLWRKITVNVIIQRLQTFFYFCHVLRF